MMKKTIICITWRKVIKNTCTLHMCKVIYTHFTVSCSVLQQKGFINGTKILCFTNLANILIGSLVINVLLDVVKYFPPTFKVTHSEFNFEHNAVQLSLGITSDWGWVYIHGTLLTGEPTGMKLSLSATYRISSSLQNNLHYKVDDKQVFTVWCHQKCI